MVLRAQFTGRLHTTQAQLTRADDEHTQQKVASVCQPLYEGGHTKALVHKENELHSQPPYDSPQLSFVYVSIHAKVLPNMGSA